MPDELELHDQTSSVPPSPRSLHEQLAAGRREGFYAHAAQLLERRLAQVWSDRQQLRLECDRLTRERRELEQQLDEWRRLALKYGAELQVDFRQGALEGTVRILPEIALRGRESIAIICLELAHKMSNEARRA